MKKSISIWSFQEKSIGDCMRLAAAAGFEGIELAMDGAGELTPETKEEGILKLKEEAESCRIKIHSVASGLYWDYSLTSDQEDEREKACQIAEKQIHTAKLLGADSVLIVPGAVGVDFLPQRPVVAYDMAYQRALKEFSRIKKTAEACQIHVGIENVWNKFLVSPLEMKNFIDEIDSPYVGSYFDVGNVVHNGYPEQWIRILGKRIKKVHFKDYRRAAGGIHGFVDLLAGDVDWKEVIKAFEEIGYDGWCTAEMLPPYAQYSSQLVYNTSASMERIFKKK